jgi:hypothetical protein
MDNNRKADTVITLPQPNAYRVIVKGNSAEIEGVSLYDCRSSNSAVATASFVNGNVRVTGNQAGAVSVAVGSNRGVVSLYNYQISDPARIKEYTLKQGGELFFATPGTGKNSPVLTVPPSAYNSISWTSSDSGVATVSPNGSVTAVSEGAAIITGRFTDIWGVAREVCFLVGVGVPLGAGDLSTLATLTNHGELIITDVHNGYTPDSLAELAAAVENGKAVLNSEEPTATAVQNAIEKLLDALNGLEKLPCGDINIIEGDDGRHYKPVGHPPNVYEVVNPDGSSKYEPPEYVYAPDGKPGNGKEKPAIYCDRAFWVESPDGSNIYKMVDKNGDLRESPVVWGGFNGLFCTDDDMEAFLFEDGSYWIHMGQNVWREIGKTTIGPLTGGGPDGDPTTEPVKQIFDNTKQDGKYYVGPLGVDDDGFFFYYGDSLSNGNGKLDSTEFELIETDEKFYKDDSGKMTTQRPPLPITDKPKETDGEILTPAQCGDSVSWVEVARNGDYSLIVRSKFINVYNGYYDEESWQVSPFGTTNVYKDSAVRTKINAWWNRTAVGVADNLSADARLRRFTVQSNAASVIGIGNAETGGLENGFSKPSNISIPSGSEDIAFALSFTEAANFASKTYAETAGGSSADSSTVAAANFGKIKIPAGYLYGMWLRSPGETADTAGAVDNNGRAFRFKLSAATSNDKGLVYPALWVRTAIFAEDL